MAAINQVKAGQCNSAFLENSPISTTVYASHIAPPRMKKTVTDCYQYGRKHEPVDINENSPIMRGMCRFPLIMIILHAINSCTGVEAATYTNKMLSVSARCLIFRLNPRILSPFEPIGPEHVKTGSHSEGGRGT